MPIGLAGLPDSVSAQAHPLEITFENDALHKGPPGAGFSDQEYSHGLIVAWERSTAPLWGALFHDLALCSPGLEPGVRCLQTRFEVGQKIFTPEISEPIPSPLERPYAGWLFGAATARVATGRTLRSLRLELGMTGPASLAGDFQEIVHDVTGFPKPQGWAHQLRTEPGVLAEYEERHVREHRSEAGTRIADVSLAMAAAAGNVRTGLRGGIAVRAGHRLPHPWERLADEQPFALYAFGAIERRWTAHDLFLDGNTFTRGPRVERIPYTGSIAVGTGAQFRTYRITAAVVFEDRLYTTQPKAHRYNSVTLTINP